MSNCTDCTTKVKDYFSDELYTWCTACGNYAIHAAMKRALVAENRAPKDVLLCFDVGCHGNGSDKIGGYAVHGLHGRIIAFASGACMANNRVKTIAFGGDGGTFSEGISHLIHAVRSNYNMTFILHNNRNYGLTTGQASSTTPQEVPMHASPDGVTADPIHPMEFVLGLNPSFAARSFSGNVKHMTYVFQEAIKHKGFSFVEILQDCPTYNKATPHDWYMERVFPIPDRIPDYDPYNHIWAKEVAQDMQNNIALGIIYRNEKKTFLERQVNRIRIESELVDEVKQYDIDSLVKAFQ